MTDYRQLSEWKKSRTDKEVVDEIEPKHHVNKHNGFEFDEPDYTLHEVHNGNYCAKCWMIYYNCLCGHY